MRKACVASLSLITALLLCAGTAFAAPYGMFRLNHGPSRPKFLPADFTGAASPRLVRYYGGPVISRAKVYAVFWGRNVVADVRAGIGPFYANILNSGYIDWLSEYDTGVAAVDVRAGTGQTIGRGSYAGAVTIAPANKSATLTDAMIQRELAAQIAAGHLPPSDANTLYMVYFPAGIGISLPDGSRSCRDFDAYHEGFTGAGTPVYYGVMPDCGEGFNALSVTSSHETIEAITDPFPTNGAHPAYPQAWNSATGDEIADLCDSVNTSYVTSSGGLVSDVEPGWSDSANACNMGPWTTAGQTVKFPARVVSAGFRLEPSPIMAVLAHANSLPVPWDGR
ncbi:MAG TPA: hypothetical protein VNK24_08425 [Elusimicrobiota bacterium]|nr:hypothetical protein [Elusimicrobiota bacterium]